MALTVVVSKTFCPCAVINKVSSNFVEIIFFEHVNSFLTLTIVLIANVAMLYDP